MKEIAHQRLDERNADKRCRLGQSQRPVQVEQAYAKVEDNVQRANEHRRQADPEPYRLGSVALSDRLKASPQDLRSIRLEPRPTPPWSGHWRLAPGFRRVTGFALHRKSSCGAVSGWLNATVPPRVLFFIAVNIRKFVLRAAWLSELVELGSMTPRSAAFLEASVRAGLNILVAGGTQAARYPRYCRKNGPPPGQRRCTQRRQTKVVTPSRPWHARTPAQRQMSARWVLTNSVRPRGQSMH